MRPLTSKETMELAVKYTAPLSSDAVRIDEVQALSIACVGLLGRLERPRVYVVYRVDEDTVLRLPEALEGYEPGGPCTNPWEMLVKIKKAFVDEEDARREAERLNEINADKGCRYLYQDVAFVPEDKSPQKHRQVGPPVMVGSYRVRVVSDSENPTHLAKATVEEQLGGSTTVYGTPRVPTLVATDQSLLVGGEHFPVHAVPNDALAAILKVAGWKVTPP